MPKRAKGTGFHYRDTWSGKFVPKSTWKRSKAQGGTRYKREKQERKKPKEEEYQINVKYKPSDKSTKVEVQISARGPRNKTRTQVIQAMETRRRTGEDPRGWKIDIHEWKKAGKVFKSDSGWTQLGFFINESKKEVR